MERRYEPLGTNGFSCFFCGHPIAPNEPVTECADCGAICCKKCAEDGVLDEHHCEDDDECEE